MGDVFFPLKSLSFFLYLSVMMYCNFIETGWREEKKILFFIIMLLIYLFYSICLKFKVNLTLITSSALLSIPQSNAAHLRLQNIREDYHKNVNKSFSLLSRCTQIFLLIEFCKEMKVTQRV